MPPTPRDLTITDRFDQVEITYSAEDGAYQARLERNGGGDWQTVDTGEVETDVDNMFRLADDSPLFYGGVEYRVVHDGSDETATSATVSTTPAESGPQMWADATGPEDALAGSTDQAVDALIGSDLTPPARSVAETLLGDPPEEFYVEGHGGGIIIGTDGVRFGSAGRAEVWLDRMAIAEQVAENNYPAFHDEHFGLPSYDPELVGPGKFTANAVDETLWSNFEQEFEDADERSETPMANPAPTLAGQYEEIRLADDYAIGTAVGFASACGSASNYLRLHTGNSAPDGHLDPVASALQTFLEDALVTLLIDHSENFVEYFDYAEVPIVDTR